MKAKLFFPETLATRLAVIVCVFLVLVVVLVCTELLALILWTTLFLNVGVGKRWYCTQGVYRAVSRGSATFTLWIAAMCTDQIIQ